jgi:hypothetical protein
MDEDTETLSEDQILAMSLEEFLRRLSLDYAYPKFVLAKVTQMNDVKSLGSGDLKGFGVETRGEQERLLKVLQNNLEALRLFYRVCRSTAIRELTILFPKEKADDLADAIYEQYYKVRSAPKDAKDGVSSAKSKARARERFPVLPFSAHQLRSHFGKPKYEENPWLAITELTPLLSPRPVASTETTPSTLNGFTTADAQEALAALQNDTPMRLFLWRLGWKEYEAMVDKNMVTDVGYVRDWVQQSKGHLGSLGISKIGDQNLVNDLFSDPPKPSAIRFYGLASRSVIQHELKAFFGNKEEDLQRELLDAIPPHQTTVARLLDFLRKYQSNPQQIKQNLKDLLKPFVAAEEPQDETVDESVDTSLSTNWRRKDLKTVFGSMKPALDSSLVPLFNAEGFRLSASSKV